VYLRNGVVRVIPVMTPSYTNSDNTGAKKLVSDTVTDLLVDRFVLLGPAVTSCFRL
jgi:hypothetical protein